MRLESQHLKLNNRVGIFIKFGSLESNPPIARVVRIYFNDLFQNLELTGGILYRLQLCKNTLACCEICHRLVQHAYIQSHHPEVIFNGEKLFSFLKPFYFQTIGHEDCLRALHIPPEPYFHLRYVDSDNAEVSIYSALTEVA